MIRPRIAAAAKRWREALAGAGLVVLGLWWMASTGLLVWVGGAVAALGAVVAFTGVQRARFEGGGQGPGIARVDEGRVLYMGPRDGGSADLAGLRAVTLDPAGSDGPTWVLDGPEALRVPAAALGADALLDAFAALPGFDTSRAVAALRRPGASAVTIWRAPGASPAIAGRGDRGLPPGSS